MAQLSEKTRLKAKANTLKIEGFRTMSLDELAAAVAKAEGTKKNGTNGTVAKGAAIVKGAVQKGAAAVAKGRAITSVEAQAMKELDGTDKSKRQPAKKAVAPKGKVSTPAAKGTTAAKASTQSPAKSTSQKPAPAKGAAAKGTASRTASGEPPKGKVARAEGKAAFRSVKAEQVTGKGGYTTIDVSSIDWDAEAKVGQTGKRALVLKFLRRFKGDNEKVFNKLSEHAVEWYPNAYLTNYGDGSTATKTSAAERQLKWLIGRVRYDFVYKTGQHTAGRAGVYGEKAAKGKTPTPPKAKPTTIAALAKETAAEKKAAGKASAPAGTPAKGKATSKPIPAAKGRTAAPRAKATPVAKPPAKKAATPKPAAKPARRAVAPPKVSAAKRSKPAALAVKG